MPHLFDSGKNSTNFNMKLDQKLLNTLDENGEAILHLYDWEKKSLTYGYFLNPSDYLNESFCKNEEVDIARRPTGGGILFHLWDIAFSFLIPKNHPFYSTDVMKTYQFVNERVVEAIQLFVGSNIPLELLQHQPMPSYPKSERVCFAHPTKYDIMLEGKKLVGAAQRRKKNGILHQGSISLVKPSFTFLEQIFCKDIDLVNAIFTQSYFLVDREKTIEEAKKEMRIFLQKVFCEL